MTEAQPAEPSFITSPPSANARDAFPLPENLPRPEQTDEAVHLAGHPLPPLIELPKTGGGYVDLFLASLQRPILLFIYPRTAKPGEDVPADWNAIPGARGCTPHLCSVSDSVATLRRREPTLEIYGLSVQTPSDQQEVHSRLQLPFDLLSDEKLALQRSLDLPTLQWRGSTYLQRATLLLRDGQITQYQHPVFPPNTAAQEALKMLDAGKTNANSHAAGAATAPSSATSNNMNAAYPAQIESQTFPNTARDLTGSIKSFKGLQRLSRRNVEWRNSLVALDNETGEVIGILAQNVALSSAAANASPCRSSRDTNEHLSTPDEIPTPTGEIGLLDYQAAARYDDPDVRPLSRQGSVLGEETFAPPPLPQKSTTDIGADALSSFALPSLGANRDEDGVVDGRVSLHAKHVETHRPDLLRDLPRLDTDQDEDDDTLSRASGSTFGGPLHRLLYKARRRSDEKRKQRSKRVKSGDEAYAAAGEQDAPNNSEIPRAESPIPVLPNASEEVTSMAAPEESIVAPLDGLNAPSAETLKYARAHRIGGAAMEQNIRGVATSHIQSVEDRVWQSALETESLPIDGAYTHLPAVNRAREDTKQFDIAASSTATRHIPLMKGNSVLIEFLGGSRIAASVIETVNSQFFGRGDARVEHEPFVPGSFTPTSVNKIERDGVFTYMPMLPPHLLWLFGFTEGKNAKAQQDCSDPSNEVTSKANSLTAIGQDFLEIISEYTPTHVIQSILKGTTYSAVTAWNLGLEASRWVAYAFERVRGPQDLLSDEMSADIVDLSHYEPGEEDAAEWEWTLPGAFHPDSLGNTPRPIYRRKRPTPSAQNGFNVRKQGDSLDEGGSQHHNVQASSTSSVRSRYSVIHFDHLGVGRHAVMRANLEK